MELREVTISYRASVKANLGNYESADISESRAETWMVIDEPDEKVQQFIAERRKAIKEEIDTYLEDGYVELKGGSSDG
jgi:hypothetical protein